MKYGNVSLGQVEAAINRMGGLETFHRFLSGELELKEVDFLRLLHDDLVIQIPALPRPTFRVLRARYSWVKDIECNNSTEEAVTLRLATVLRSTERSINGQTYALRLENPRSEGKLLGFQHQQWLLDNQQSFPALMALLGEIYIDFPGLVMVLEGRRRSVPCVRSAGGGLWFVEDWVTIGSGFSDRGRIAVAA